MGCCTSFSATSTTMRLDPGHYVNFTTGMVLGAEDYLQGHTYLAERIKRVVRELDGYGTISGLEVSPEVDAEKGPVVRVTPGSAAAPSGQLICVGREQCGGVNQWLATEEIDAALNAMDRDVGDPGSLQLPIWLVLCYKDCAVAPVPVPGEPCRSDEELMVPSRIADDYSLSFALAPPTMVEAEAITKLNAWMNMLIVGEGDGAEHDDLQGLIGTATAQLDAIFPSADIDAEPVVPSAFAPLTFVPNLAPAFFAAIKRLWITRWRPRVMAVKCNTLTHEADDCVMLARIDMRVEKSTSNWVVANLDTDGEIDGVDWRLDQSDRPLLLASNMAQTPGGVALSDSGYEEQLELVHASLLAPGDAAYASAITNGYIIVVGDDPVPLTIPGASDDNRGDMLVIRLASAATGSVSPAAGTIAGEDNLSLDGISEVHLRGIRGNNWAVIRSIKRAGG